MVTMGGGTRISGDTSQESRERTLYNIRYSILLNDDQLDYLADDSQDINRMKCFKTFLRLAVMEPTKVVGKNYTEELQVGQFVASKVELADMWGCDRKTATRIVREFNMMGIIESRATNRTTIHTLKSLSVWFTKQETVKNRFFNINPAIKPLKPYTNVPPKMKLKARDGGRNESGLSAGTSCREIKEKEYGRVIILHDKAETDSKTGIAPTALQNVRGNNKVDCKHQVQPKSAYPIPQSSNISGEANNGQTTLFPNDGNRTHLSASGTGLSKSKQIEILSNESGALAHTTARDNVP